MSLPKPSTHVRLSHEADAKLALLAEMHQLPKSVVAEQFLEEAILGKAHVLTVAARKLCKLGLAGSDGE